MQKLTDGGRLRPDPNRGAAFDEAIFLWTCHGKKFSVAYPEIKLIT